MPPPNNSSVPTLPALERSSRPAIAITIASSVVRSSPRRRASLRGHAEQCERRGRQHPQHAGHGGTETELLAEHVQQRVIEVTAVRRLIAASRIAANARTRRAAATANRKGGTHRWSLQVSHAGAMACSASVYAEAAGGEGLLAGRQRGHCTCGLRQGPVMRAARCLIQKPGGQ